MKRLVRVFVVLRCIEYCGDTVVRVWNNKEAAEADAAHLHNISNTPGITFIVEDHEMKYANAPREVGAVAPSLHADVGSLDSGKETK